MSEFISGEEVKKLALLARIEIRPAEVKKLQKDLGAILGYVSQLKETPIRESAISIPPGTKAPEIFNVFREDEPIKGEADIKKGEHIKVKHIF